MTNTLKTTIHGVYVSEQTGQPLEYAADFVPSNWIDGCATVELFNQWNHDGGSFPASDLSAVIAMLMDLRERITAAAAL